ncbi:hypothetical protein LguiA_013717 [Lonicera macranthoides]
MFKPLSGTFGPELFKVSIDDLTNTKTIINLITTFPVTSNTPASQFQVPLDSVTL